MKRVIVLLFAIFLLCSCSSEAKSPKKQISAVSERCSETLGAVSVYHSDAREGEAGYIDGDMVSAMLGEGTFPDEMSGVEEYSVICPQGMRIGEVWMLRCRTYSSAREVYELFEKRKKLITSPEYEDERDEAAAGGTVLLREGKYVYFAVCENGAQIVGFLSGRDV